MPKNDVMHILFIDDDHEDYEMFCEAMKAINPEAICINRENGISGLTYLQRSHPLPDYIFLDIHMPVMGGVECLKQIKADQRLKDIPVIIYTSDTDPQWPAASLNRYQDLGAVHFIPKTHTFRKIVKKLTAFFLGGSHQTE